MRVINNNTNAASEKNSVLLKIWIESMLKVQDSRIMGMSENVFKISVRLDWYSISRILVRPKIR